MCRVSKKMYDDRHREEKTEMMNISKCDGRASVRRVALMLDAQTGAQLTSALIT